jgi:hypothetical protein
VYFDKIDEEFDKICSEAGTKRMKTLRGGFFFLQFGVRGGGPVNFVGIFESEGADGADFDAFAALIAP